jgi:ATP-binding cassette subfamily F protein uup
MDEVQLEIRQRERICLIGRNGSGKSSLLKIISGEITADSGVIEKSPGYRIAVLPQEVPQEKTGSVESVLHEGLQDSSLPAWDRDLAVERMAADIQLNPDEDFAKLSAGMKRRVLLGRAAIDQPDLLLLDEPTNHLDVASIEWLENFLQRYQGALLFVTHDRMFLQKLAQAVVDLDRGRLTRWEGDYENYLRRKEEWLNAEAKNWAIFDKKLAEEEVWIRKGIQARRTRNEGRVRSLLKMREEHRQRRQRTGNAQIQIDSGERTGVRVIRAENVSFAYEGKKVIDNFSFDIERGDRVGIVGPNGSGKTTLIRVLLGKLKPASGAVVHGTNLKIAYFDQLRDSLNDQATVQDNVADGADVIETTAGRKHVISYLGDFLFTPDRARSPVSMLSGGERNRLLLARLFTRPCNVLVMDEPTNDLDMETLDLLEEKLAEFKGTLLLVSHDRAFLNNVVTELLVFEGEGRVQSCVGGYDDYQKLKVHQALQSKQVAAKNSTNPPTGARPQKVRKFLNRERWELEAIPGKIEKLEKHQQSLTEKLADPAFYQGHANEIAEVREQVESIENQIMKKMQRWEELEKLKAELE